MRCPRTARPLPPCRTPTAHAWPPQDPAQRLGAQAGADEIKQHPWFAEVCWALGRDSRATLARASARAPSVKRAASAKAGPSKLQAFGSSKAGAGGGGSSAAPRTPKRSEEGGAAVMGCFSMRRRRT